MKASRLLAIVAVALMPFIAASAEKLNIRIGLWEITSVSQVSGKQAAAEAPRTETDRECITQQKVDHPFESPQDDDCQHTIVQTTRTTQEVRLTCTGAHKGAGVFRITTPTPETMTGTLDLRVGEGDHAMTVKWQLNGRWLGPDCGDEDEEAEDSGDQEEREEDE